jgi:hypothetical protein
MGRILLFTVCLFLLLQIKSFSQNCSVSGGTINTNDITGTLCTRVGISHLVNINVNNSTGSNSRIVIINDLFEIVAISETRSIDLGGLVTGAYSIFNVSFENMTGLVVGNDTYNLSGCYSFSNNIDVAIIAFNGGDLRNQNGGTEVSICVDDGVADFPNLVLTGNAGNGRVWATTDLSDNIIDLDCCRGPDFEGTGAGVVKLYSISACLTIQGISIGMNINDIPSNTDASNAVIITKRTGCCVPTVFYRDSDGDGYGNANNSIEVCPAPAGYVSNKQDCNDDNAAINPAAVEICGNGIDDNCNGAVDEQGCSCKNASTFSTTNITSNSAMLNWVSIPNPTAWHIQYKSTRAGAKWIDVNPDLAGNKRSLKIAGLSRNQGYQWHIKAKCGNIWTAYSASVSFTTTNSINTQSRPAEIAEEGIVSTSGVLNIQASPNPSKKRFILVVGNSMLKEPVRLIVTDMQGKVVERRVTTAGQTISIGENYKSGLYLIRALQGNEQKILKLVKLD